MSSPPYRGVSAEIENINLALYGYVYTVQWSKDTDQLNWK